MQASLTPPERETVILGSDADDFITIWTAQRPVITKLRANAAAELIEEGHSGTTAWAKFKLPAGLITFRTGRTRISDEERARRADHMREVAATRRAAA